MKKPPFSLGTVGHFLKEHDVKVEDPDHEIGPEAEGSPNVGLWLHDPDGYRLELSVQNGAKDL